MKHRKSAGYLLLCTFVALWVGPLSRPAHAQGYDTVRVMTSNLLDYPGNSSPIRNPEFRKIMRYADPDILVVQEMLSSTGVSEFLSSVLNYGQPGTYTSAPFMDGPDTDNAMFFKTDRFSYIGQVVLHTELRDINGYQLRPSGINGDSLDLRIYSAHLKSSQGSEAQRFAEADTLRNHLNALPDGLFLMAAGDFNLYTSSEPAYQELIGSQSDNSGRLFDPINTLGSWNNNAQYASVHTQSTRVENLGDGGATGGLDDRFDFVLTSSAFQSGTRWHYVPESYTELGNDGAHFNLSINDGFNAAVPDTIADALYLASDHLPVFLDLCRPVGPPASITVIRPNGGELLYIGSVDTLIWSSSGVTGNVQIQLNRSYPSGSWETLFGSAINDGHEPWIVSGPASTNARIRVFSAGNPGIGDTSSSDFEIRMPWNPPQIVHDPHGDDLPGQVTFTALVWDNQPNPIAKLYSKRSDDPVFDSLSMTQTGFDDEVAATLSLEFGRYSYFIRAIDSDLQSSSTDTFEFVVAPTGGIPLAYGDSSAELYNWSYDHRFEWAVRFSPTDTPFALAGADFGIAGFHPDSSHNPIIVRVLSADGSGGLPGTVLREVVRGSIGNVIGGLSHGSDYFAHVNLYDDADQPLVFDTDFYVSVSNPVGGTEAFGTDTSSESTGHSYFWDPCVEAWYPEFAEHPNARNGNRQIRAQGWSTSPPLIVIQTEGNDVVLHWSPTGAPYYRVHRAMTPGGPFDTALGVTSDTQFVDRGVVDPNVRLFYLVTSVSTP